jgi:hypothetical protein
VKAQLPIVSTDSPDHYSGTTFEDTQMIQGASTMPLPTNPPSFGRGNNANGAIRVPRLSKITSKDFFQNRIHFFFFPLSFFKIFLPSQSELIW